MAVKAWLRLRSAHGLVQPPDKRQHVGQGGGGVMNEYATAGLLKDLHMPVLIMWGDRDRIIHVSTVSVFQQGIPQAQTVIFKDCGHMPMLEIPRESAKAYATFLEGLKQQAKND